MPEVTEVILASMRHYETLLLVCQLHPEVIRGSAEHIFLLCQPLQSAKTRREKSKATDTALSL